ncbi:uncharacterized protein LOC18433747 [Amborella trichopoda]|uniref:DUF7642 domain-containing protein n=1 Tax=Amborella trichopoda TaxID=13333 RepID=W1PD65_AMBTC|nr:uncharacterized protein LOC18433747 [Amborella trichopoda]ERN05566.1 hypothetical protein AMTR_s00007p00266750 [Amborella trichopoda]|eukprot:XP_006843891.1 uncharacterized protein LOC18433747 [Amborella trichopoda]
MGSEDGVIEVDRIERRLLSDEQSQEHNEVGDETVLYKASFEEMEDNFVKYQTTQWVMYSLLLIVAWGAGLIMLLYLPIRRYIVRRDFRSRKLYVTPNAIIYKVTRPVFLPCFGVLKKEKHVLLPSVTDVVVEQGYLQSKFGIYSIRLENSGVRRPPSDDIQIQGIVHPRAFRKAILVLLANMRKEGLAREVSVNEGMPSFGSGFHCPPPLWARINVENRLTPRSMSPCALYHDAFHSSEELILQKLEEVGSSVKRVQSLIEVQNPNQQTLSLEATLLRSV